MEIPEVVDRISRAEKVTRQEEKSVAGAWNRGDGLSRRCSLVVSAFCHDCAAISRSVGRLRRDVGHRVDRAALDVSAFCQNRGGALSGLPPGVYGIGGVRDFAADVVGAGELRGDLLASAEFLERGERGIVGSDLGLDVFHSGSAAQPIGAGF